MLFSMEVQVLRKCTAKIFLDQVFNYYLLSVANYVFIKQMEQFFTAYTVDMNTG